jgi:hypothetical protein
MQDLLCVRLDSVRGTNDFYEPDEPDLERAGLPWFYFIPDTHTLLGERKEPYLRESVALWGEDHMQPLYPDQRGPDNYVLGRRGPWVVVCNVRRELVPILRSLGGHEADAALPDRSWEILVAPIEEQPSETGKLFTLLRNIGLPFGTVSTPMIVAGADTFRALRQAGHAAGSFREFTWREDGHYDVREA